MATMTMMTSLMEMVREIEGDTRVAAIVCSSDLSTRDELCGSKWPFGRSSQQQQQQ
jgi:hypothetical protein